MSEKITYISLQEAAKLCSYSQDYLSLRARQGKLRARKIGRNWVTTQEWLDDYIQRAETSRNGYSGPPDRGKLEAKLVFPPQNLPVQETGVVLEREGTFLTFRGTVVTLALLAFVVIGLRSGEQGVLAMYQNGVAAALEVQETGKQVVLGAQDVPENLSDLGQSFQRGVKHAAASPTEFADAYVNLVAKSMASAAERVAGAYAKTDQALSQGIRSDLSGIAEGYRAFNDTVDSLFAKAVGLRFFATEEPALQHEQVSEEISETPADGERSSGEQGSPTQIVQQPVREVVREVLDSTALNELKAQVAGLLDLQGDVESLRVLAERIQSHPPDIVNPVAPVYIGSSGIQVGGNGNFATLGVSGPVGVQSLGVGTSASFGMNSSDTFIVRGTATFSSPVTLSSSTLTIPGNLNIDSGTLFIDSANKRVGIGTITPDQLLTLNDGSLAFSTSGGVSDVLLSRGAANRLDLADGDSLRIIGGQLQLDLNDTGSSQGIVFGLLADTNLYRSSANTLATDDKLLIGSSGLALDVQNITDEASNQVAAFRAGNRATPANNDQGYLSFTLNNSVGTQAEFGRLTFSALDVTSSSKDGALVFSTQVADTLTDTLYIRGGNVGIGVANPANRLTVGGGGDILSMGDEFGSSGIEFHNLTNTASYGALYASLADGSVLHLTTSSTLPLVLQTNGGEVGIGLTNPSTRLALAGTGSANGITLGDDAANSVNLYRSAADTLKTDDDFVVGGGLTVLGLTTSQGAVDLGDNVTDTITFVGVVDSDINPEVSSQYDIGTPSKRWATVYADTVDATSLSGTVTGGSTTSANWNINSDNATANAEISSLSFETGSGAFNATLQWNASGDTGSKVSGFDDTILSNYPLAIFSEVSGGNQTFTSGTLFKYSQPVAHAITQSGAFTGINLDFSSNITVPDSASGNQTGLTITLKDGGASAGSTAVSLGGTFDTGIDLSSATIGSAAISLPAGTAAAQGIDFGGDVTLYRSAENELKSDDNLTVGLDITTGGTFRLNPASDRPLLVNQFDAFTSGVKSGFGRWGLYQESFTLVVGVPGTDYGAGTSSLRFSGWLADSTRQDWVTIEEGGNVGIGTTDPDQLLTLDDGSIGFSTGDGASDVILSRGAANRLDLATGDDLYVVSGEVGIGTAPVSGQSITIGGTGQPADYAGLVFRGSVGSSSTAVVVIDSQVVTDASAITVDAAYGLLVRGASVGAGSAVTDMYGAEIVATGGSNNYALALNAASTQTLWISNNADNTTAAAGIAFGVSRDTNLYRSAASVLKTDDSFVATTSINSAGNIYSSAGDVGVYNGNWVVQLTNTSGGAINFGSGSGAPDTNLYRSAADTLVTDDSFRIGNTASNTASLLLDSKAAATTSIFRTSVQDDSGARMTISADGTIAWGSGSGAVDASLFRGAADRLDLASGDSFNIVSGDLTVNTDDLYVQQSTGRVGVGTIAPTSLLDVGSGVDLQTAYADDSVKAITVTNSSNDSAIYLGQDTTHALKILWDYNATAANAQAVIRTFGATNPIVIQSSNILTTAAGQLQLPITGSSAGLLIGGDVQLYRGTANTLDLGTDDLLRGTGSAASTAIFRTTVSGDSANRFGVNADGTLSWGTGSASFDTSLSRGAADRLDLASGDSLYLVGGQLGIGAVSTANRIINGSLSSSPVAGTGTYGLRFDLTRTSASNTGSIVGVYPQLIVDGVATTFADTRAIEIPNATVTNGTLTSQYGIYVNDLTSGGSDYGIAIAGADTQALWISSAVDTTDAANGIAFGASRDTNLYRSAADVLKTDDSFVVTTKSAIGQSAISGNNVLKIAGATDTAGSGGSILGIYGGTVTATANSDNIETIYATTTVAKGGFTGLKAYGLWIDAMAQSGAGTISNAYGLNVAAQTIGTDNYGVKIDAASTQTLWVGAVADSTTAAAGIAFGSSRDTNLYRGAANVLKTDDALTTGAGITATTGDITVTAGKFITGASGQTVGLQLDGFVDGGSFNNYVLNNSPSAGTYATLNFGRLVGTEFGFIRSNNNTQAIEIGTAATPRLTIDSSGNVGIGTTTPATTLDVSGSIWASANLSSAAYLSSPTFNTAFGGIGRYENMLTYSEQIDNGAYGATRSTVGADSTAAPDGTTTAEKLTEDGTASSTHYVRNVTAMADDTVYTFSMFMKAGERTYGALYLRLRDDGEENAIFNLSTGTLVSSTGDITSTSIEPYGNGWYRVSATFNSSSGGILSPRQFIAFALSNDGSGLSYSGDNASGAYTWGWQLEAQSNRGVYAQVTDTAITTTGKGLVLNSGGPHLFLNGNVGIGTTSPTGSFTVAGGNITGGATATGTSTTVDGTDSGSGTTLVVADTSGIDVGNLILVNGATWTRVTANGGGAPGNLTIEPAIARSSGQSVAEYTTPTIGSTNIQERFDKGYFMNGVVTGSASTTYADNSITFGGGSKVTDSSGKLTLQAGGATAGDGNNASIYFTDSSGNTRGRLDTANLSGVTDDGALSVTTGTTTLNQTATTQNSGNDSTGSTIYAVSTSGFSANDAVLIMQMKGGTPGNYEVVIVTEVVSGTQLSVTPALSNTYTQTTNSRCIAGDTNCAQVIRVPRHTTITCTGGTITAPAWDTATGVGGILWAQATGDVSISSSCVVDMNGKGYGGGAGTTGGAGGGVGGAGSVGSAGNAGGGPGAGGGGGTGGSAGGTNGGGAGGAPGGGGGGGNNSAGSAGAAGTSGTGGNNGGGGSGGSGGAGTAGSAGASVSVTITSRIVMGSGGGSGASGNGGGGGNFGGASGGNGGAGGTGGGIIVFHSATSVTNSATIRSTGSNGSNGTSGNTGPGSAGGQGSGGGSPGAAGGGGSGGSIWLNAPSVTAGTLTATAGSAGTAGATGGDGGLGGSGCPANCGGSGSVGAGGGGGSFGGVGGNGSGGSAGAGGAGAAGKTDSSTNTTLPGSSYGTFFVASTNTSSADVAELYLTNDESIVPGDIVVWDKNEEGVKGLKKANVAYSSKMVGAVSTNPGVLLGNRDGAKNEDKRAVALSGRIPVKVSAINGPIEAGDGITSSPIPGFGMKATQPGRIVGFAMEEFAPENPEQTGVVQVFVSLELFIPPYTSESALSSGTILLETTSPTSTVSGTTADALTSDFFKRLVEWFQGVTLKVLTLVADLIQTKTIQTEFAQYKDRATGSVYCVWIENGEFVKAEGACGESGLEGETVQQTSGSSESGSSEQEFFEQPTSSVPQETETVPVTETTTPTAEDAVETPPEEGVVEETAEEPVAEEEVPVAEESPAAEEPVVEEAPAVEEPIPVPVEEPAAAE